MSLDANERAQHVQRVQLAWPDAEVSTIVERDGDLVIRFAVAQATCGDERSGYLDGYVPAVEMICLAAQPVRQDADAIGRVAASRLCVQGRAWPTMWLQSATPTTTLGDIDLELLFANGAVCRVRAQGVRVQTDGPLRFIESLRC